MEDTTSHGPTTTALEPAEPTHHTPAPAKENTLLLPYDEGCKRVREWRCGSSIA